MIFKNLLYPHFLIFLSMLLPFMVLTTDAGADYRTNLQYSGYIQYSSGDIDVGSFSVPVVYDWNNDGRKDLLVGLRDPDVSPPDGGYISYFENTGANASPSFESSTYIQACSDTCRLTVAAWA